MKSMNPLQRPTTRSGRPLLLRTIGIAGLVLLGVAATRQRQPLLAKHAAPTFAEDVAPILYRNCTTCHRPGGIGPFSLLEYADAKKKVDDIADAVGTGYMPPWHADGPRGVFRNDRRLSDADKQTILRWIQDGAPSGDLKALPPKPVYTADWEIGVPDAVVSMGEDFKVPASGTIEYQYFEIPTNFTEDKWVQAIEFKPGARPVVHHVIVFAKVPPPPGAAAPTPPPAPAPGTPRPQPLIIRNESQRTPPDSPRLDSLHPPPRQLGTILGGTAPGTNVMQLPPGAALRLRAGTVLTFQMHYTANGHEMHDRTSVGFRFAKEPPAEEIRMQSFQNGSFTLPAGAKDVAVPADITFTRPVRIWGLLPHTHLRGTRWQYTLEKPDGTSEIILDVPRYDFNWQTFYTFAEPLAIPAGGKIVSTAWYDNSASNPHNPDPKIDVKWGDQTWEEMQFTGFLYSLNTAPAKPGSR